MIAEKAKDCQLEKKAYANENADRQHYPNMNPRRLIETKINRKSKPHRWKHLYKT